MNLTPLDIRKQDFDSKLWGYDPEDVEAFLDMVATQWEEAAEERRRLESKVQELQQQMAHYKKVEEALQEALDQTRRNAEQQLENAKQEAKNIVQEAKAEAQEIKQQARAQRDQLENEADSLEARRNEVAARLRAFLQSELEILDTYRKESDASEPAPRAQHETPGAPAAGLSPLDAPSEDASGPGGEAPEPAGPTSAEDDRDEATAEKEDVPDEDAVPAEDFQDSLSDAMEEREPDVGDTTGRADWTDEEDEDTGDDEWMPEAAGEEPLETSPPRSENAGAPGALAGKSEIEAEEEVTPEEPDAADVESTEREADAPEEKTPPRDPSPAPTAENAGTDTDDTSPPSPGASAPEADEADGFAPDAPDQRSEEEADAAEEKEQEASTGEKKEKKKKETGKEEEASTEEIEKIWRILEDME